MFSGALNCRVGEVGNGVGLYDRLRGDMVEKCSGSGESDRLERF